MAPAHVLQNCVLLLFESITITSPVAADGSDGKEMNEAEEVQKDLVVHLRTFIRTNDLKQTILRQMTDTRFLVN